MAVTLLLALLVSALAASTASAQQLTVTNPNTTTLIQGAAASPYPSQLDVSGMSGPISKVTVKLTDFTLGSSAFDLVLVSPHGETVMLTSDVFSEFSSATYTFDDAASGNQPNPDSNTSTVATYKPTDDDSNMSNLDTFPSGVEGPFGSTMSALNGQSPNGTWKLYGYDGSGGTPGGTIGHISSWTLNVTTAFGVASISPASKDFGSVVSGQSSAPQSFTIANAGSGPMSITATQIQGANADQFTITSNSCSGANLDAGQSCVLDVAFKPTSSGAKSASLFVDDSTGAGGHTAGLTGSASDAPPETPPITEPPTTGPQESGSPDIKVEPPTFTEGPPVVGQPNFLTVTASDEKAAVVGLIVDFGETQGVFAESACVIGVNSGNQTTFEVPYEFLTPGIHTITITVFAGGCGTPVEHTYSFTVEVAAAKPAAFRTRTAHAASTLRGPAITSKCKDKNVSPTVRNVKKVNVALLCVINEQRKLYKLKPFKISKKLTKSAAAHTKAMISGKFFAHQGPREPALRDRLRKAKYRGSGAENIGAGAGRLGTPLSMVNGWMHSTLHRANLLNKKWKYVGIGFLPQFPIKGGSPPVATYTLNFGPKK
jgi:uncharacterized protein YkwD